MGVKIKSELSTQIEAGFVQELPISFEEIHIMNYEKSHLIRKMLGKVEDKPRTERNKTCQPGHCC